MNKIITQVKIFESEEEANKWLREMYKGHDFEIDSITLNSFVDAWNIFIVYKMTK